MQNPSSSSQQISSESVERWIRPDGIVLLLVPFCELSVSSVEREETQLARSWSTKGGLGMPVVVVGGDGVELVWLVELVEGKYPSLV